MARSSSSLLAVCVLALAAGSLLTVMPLRSDLRSHFGSRLNTLTRSEEHCPAWLRSVSSCFLRRWPAPAAACSRCVSWPWRPAVCSLSCRYVATSVAILAQGSIL
mmetsp:Transcript_9326/g.7086  ORF Transcript_9326/g.7086 Transcript_9326/m.7086 type:complete len:105 (-) Transcript_9326:26-340(-)